MSSKLISYKPAELCPWCGNQRELLRADGELEACPECSGARGGSAAMAAKAMAAAIRALESTRRSV